MHKSPALDALFPKVRQGVLTATFTRPGKWWYLSELARFLHTTPSSLQRELLSLVQSGILQQRRDGRRTYFKADTQSPMFRELRDLFEKTAGLVPSLKRALASLDAQIACAFIFGSVARSKETTGSDVDLMVIGDVGLAELAPALRKAEARLGREVNATSYSASEFRRKVASRDHFLSTILRGPKQFLKGNQRGLDEIIGEQGRPEA